MGNMMCITLRIPAVDMRIMNSEWHNGKAEDNRGSCVNILRVKLDLHLWAVVHPSLRLLKCLVLCQTPPSIYSEQPVKLLQGLNAKQAACNAYHAGVKERSHIGIDPINPHLDIRSTGQAAIQCEMISDCYAQDGDNETQETIRALAFNAEGRYISSISPDRMGLL